MEYWDAKKAHAEFISAQNTLIPCVLQLHTPNNGK